MLSIMGSPMLNGVKLQSKAVLWQSADIGWAFRSENRSCSRVSFVRHLLSSTVTKISEF